MVKRCVDYVRSNGLVSHLFQNILMFLYRISNIHWYQRGILYLSGSTFVFKFCLCTSFTDSITVVQGSWVVRTVIDSQALMLKVFAV